MSEGRLSELFNEARILQTRSALRHSVNVQKQWIKQYCQLISIGEISTSTSVIEGNYSSGEIGLFDPILTADLEFENSLRLCSTYNSGLTGMELRNLQQKVTASIENVRLNTFKPRMDRARISLSSPSNWPIIIEHAKIPVASAWLSALLLSLENYLLSP
ncbi:hypothetical protein GJ496_004986 [Pomphorhynchus laevis]|nr:hypothetical protein GJ496_004986 [Pomphorhynchus laevis]